MWRFAFGAVLAALIAASLHARLDLIDASLPYVGHVDEPFLSSNATRMLQEGTLDPGFFRYPSLPIYVTAAGVAWGAFASGTDLQDVDVHWPPFYSHPEVMVPARWAFAILSVLTLLAVASLGFRFGGAPVALLAPAVTCFSSLYFWTSWAYLNVDIVATFFTVTSLAFLFLRWNEPGWTAKVVVPGLLAGAAAASKYNAGVVLIPFGLAILFQCSDRRLMRLTLLGVWFLASFLLFVPYSLLNFERFTADVGAEILHYRAGHPGFEGDAGFAQLAFYLRALSAEFGKPVFALAGIGAIGVFRMGWRRATVLLSLPVLTMLLMSLQRVHFHRNILSVYVLMGLFAAIGVRTTVQLALRALPSIPVGRRSVVATVTAVLLTAAMTSGLPKERILGAYRPPADSRRLATEWILQQLPRGSRIMVPSHLSIDLRGVQGGYDVRSFEIGREDLSELLSESRDGDLYAVVPRFGHDPGNADGERIADDWNREMRFLTDAVGAETLQRFGFGEFPIEHGFANDPELAIVIVPAQPQ